MRKGRMAIGSGQSAMGNWQTGIGWRRSEMRDNGSKSLLAMAIEREEWEVAALCLMLVGLKAALHDRPEDLRLLERGIGMLVRAVSAQYRLSPKARKDLSDSLAAVFNSLGDHILPPDQ